MKYLKATVFIPTYNGDRYLENILTELFKQHVNFDFEILIIDSGSTDQTIPIIEKYQKTHKNLRLHKISNIEFGHGKTRNLAAQMAKGEIIVYLSHDAEPAHTRWLYEMVKPFEMNDKIVGIMGKQIPRPHCIPMLKSEITAVFSGFGPDYGTTVFYQDDFVKDQGVRDAISFYSDVNSAARRSYLVGALPYQDVPYAEDQLFGKDIINAGLYKVYAPRGSVIHSNDLRLKEYKHRMYDETRGLIKIGLPVSVPRRAVIAKLIFRGVIRDTRNIVRDRQYTFKRRLYWLAINPLFHIEKWRGIWVAVNSDSSDDNHHEAYSLERKRSTQEGR